MVNPAPMFPPAPIVSPAPIVPPASIVQQSHIVQQPGSVDCSDDLEPVLLSGFLEEQFTNSNQPTVTPPACHRMMRLSHKKPPNCRISSLPRVWERPLLDLLQKKSKKLDYHKSR
jgi:hypothetical protein